MLGDNICSLRKAKKMTQEQLAEEIDVTRQTISNWELNETAPNPEQLKLLSKALNVSIDELLNNDIQSVLVEKVSNTEKLAGIIIMILKVLGILFLIYVVLIVIAFVALTFYSADKMKSVRTSVSMICSLDENKYIIKVGSDEVYECINCDDYLYNRIFDIVDYDNIDGTVNDIERYFISEKGLCE